MTKVSQSLVLLLLGVYVARIALTNEYQSYVTPWLRWPLLLAGLVLVGIALLAALIDTGDAEDHQPERDASGHLVFDHDHSHAPPKSAWLMAVPFFVIVLIAPQPLGSYVAERRSNQAATLNWASFPPLSGEGPIKMPITEFVARAVYDDDLSLKGHQVALTGFVSFDSTSSAWFVTRISLNCCAADATAFRVKVLAAEAPPGDSWVRVVGTWQPSASGGPSVGDPELAAISVQPMAAPKREYE